MGSLGSMVSEQHMAQLSVLSAKFNMEYATRESLKFSRERNNQYHFHTTALLNNREVVGHFWCLPQAALYYFHFDLGIKIIIM